MENKDTEYKSFLIKFFSLNMYKDPKEKIQLKELDPPNRGNNLNKHIFEQLLQIFTDGMKYLYGDSSGKVCI